MVSDCEGYCELQQSLGALLTWMLAVPGSYTIACKNHQLVGSHYKALYRI